MTNDIIESFLNRLARILRPILKPRMLKKRKNFQGKKIHKTSIGNTTFIDYQKKLILHDYTYIGHHNFIEASNNIEIGEGCQITDFISLTTHSSHISIRLYGKHYSETNNLIGYVNGEIKIGEYTFIGPHSVIMPNTFIGKGSIITAYSYVKGTFPDFSIISGNPAQVIGDTRTIDKKYLVEYPNLLAFYSEWADKNN